VLLHHILDTPPHGRVGIDLHLGQKPKLGGRYADDTLIYISYFVGTLYFHVSLSFLCCSCSYFYFPKHKKTKNISVVSLCLPFSFLALVCLTSNFRLIFEKSKNILLCLLFPSVLVAKFENPKIFVVLLRFCKVCCRVQSSVTPMELGIHFILFKPQKWKAIMMTYAIWDVVRGWYELYLFFHFCTCTHLCGHA
jgi:hypothetical protein